MGARSLNYNYGEKCREASFILQIPPGDISCLKNSNNEYGGGGPQEHGICQILQPIVKIIKLGVK